MITWFSLLDLCIIQVWERERESQIRKALWNWTNSAASEQEAPSTDMWAALKTSAELSNISRVGESLVCVSECVDVYSTRTVCVCACVIYSTNLLLTVRSPVFDLLISLLKYSHRMNVCMSLCHTLTLWHHQNHHLKIFSQVTMKYRQNQVTLHY